MLETLILGAAGEPSFFSWAYWQQQEGGVSRSEVFRNFVLAAVAFFALIVASWRAWSSYLQANAANEQARIAEQGLFTDRFSTAVEHLGNEELPVRLGGIYALWRLAHDSPEQDLLGVVDILCAFVRDPPHDPRGQPEPDATENGEA